MERYLLAQLQALYEKQDILSKLTDHELHASMTYSEAHCIAAIGDLSDANATAIADALHLTRGAVSKLLKKLAAKEMIEIYQKPDNKKEKYCRLTARGELIYTRHAKAHEAWELRDAQFLLDVATADIAVVTAFLERFNDYLMQQIKEKTPL